MIHNPDTLALATPVVQLLTTALGGGIAIAHAIVALLHSRESQASERQISQIAQSRS